MNLEYADYLIFLSNGLYFLSKRRMMKYNEQLYLKLLLLIFCNKIKL